MHITLLLNFLTHKLLDNIDWIYKLLPYTLLFNKFSFLHYELRSTKEVKEWKKKTKVQSGSFFPWELALTTLLGFPAEGPWGPWKNKPRKVPLLRLLKMCMEEYRVENSITHCAIVSSILFHMFFTCFFRKYQLTQQTFLFQFFTWTITWQLSLAAPKWLFQPQVNAQSYICYGAYKKYCKNVISTAFFF